MFSVFTWFIYLFIVLQKFFDLERENACITKEQRNHTFPRLNRNKYMVTDGAAYIGRCQGCEVPQRIMQVSGNPAALCCTPWRGSPCQWMGVPKVRKQEREGKELFNQTSYLWLGSETRTPYTMSSHKCFAEIPWSICLILCFVTQLCPTHRDSMDCTPPGSSVHGILQPRILEWVAMPFSRGSSPPRKWTGVSCIAGRFFTSWTTREAL